MQRALVTTEPNVVVEDFGRGPSGSPDCVCDGQVPWCAVCAVALAMFLRRDHPLTLSVALLKRRIPQLTGREAALLLEATKYIAGDVGSFQQEAVEAEVIRELSAPEEAEREPPLVLTFNEVRALEAVREGPGSTSAELGQAVGRTTRYLAGTLRLLARGGHARREDRRWYPTHDRPLGNVHPGERIHWKRDGHA